MSEKNRKRAYDELEQIVIRAAEKTAARTDLTQEEKDRRNASNSKTLDEVRKNMGVKE